MLAQEESPVPKISEEFNVGAADNMSPSDLLRVMTTMYRELAIAINRKPDIIERTVDGVVTDTFLSNGDININTSTDNVEMLTNHTSATAVNWKTL